MEGSEEMRKGKNTRAIFDIQLDIVGATTQSLSERHIHSSPLQAR